MVRLRTVKNVTTIVVIVYILITRVKISISPNNIRRSYYEKRNYVKMFVNRNIIVLINFRNRLAMRIQNENFVYRFARKSSKSVTISHEIHVKIQTFFYDA